MKQTTVINLFAGPGAGKSTTAAGIYHMLKKANASVELVREYVKDWAWQQRKIDPLNQFYISGQQAHKESLLYGKVNWLITDSPIVLSAYYQQRYSNKNYMAPAILAFMEHAVEMKGVTYENYLLVRNKTYVPDGRFETEEQAKDIDKEMEAFLNKCGLSYTRIDEASLTSVILTRHVNSDDFNKG
jgi:thymidylate kinase